MHFFTEMFVLTYVNVLCIYRKVCLQISSVQPLSHVRLFVTP